MTNAKTHSIKINDDSEDIKEVKEAIAKNISSNHTLRVALYKCGMSYGRMLESRQNALMWGTFGFLSLGNIVIMAFEWPRWLSIILTVLWVFVLIALHVFTEKSMAKDIAEETKKLERLRDNELKEWEK